MDRRPRRCPESVENQVHFRVSWSPVLTTSSSIDQLVLADIRLLREARAGNDRALDALLEPHLSGLWSICKHHIGSEERALECFVRFRRSLGSALHGFVSDKPPGVQIYGSLWDFLTRDLEPNDRSGIQNVRPQISRTLRDAPDGGRMAIERAISGAPPYPRLLYLFALATGLPSARLAELTRESEERIRAARGHITTLLHTAMTQ